ncbi:5957_t:CDS:2, partial [Racocetra fulgida]
NSLAFNTLDGYFAIAYMDFVGSSIPNNSTYNPIDPVMSLYVTIMKDGFNQQILIFQSYDKMLKSASILNCQAVTKFIKFSTSGSVIETGTVRSISSSNLTSAPGSIIQTTSANSISSSNLSSTPASANLTNSSLGIFGAGAIFMPLKFGGYIYYNNVPEEPIYICDIINSCDSFEVPENTQLRDSGVFDNNTVWLAMEVPLSQNSFISTKDATQFIKDYGFDNPAIVSTRPEQNATLTSLSSNNMNINITFFTPIVLSTGNLTIYQVINESNYLLRQTYPALNCTLIPDSKGVLCKVLSSTFNRIDSIYTIVLDNNFVQTLSFNEPLNGIKRDIWHVKTPECNIPINSDRLYLTGSIQPDSSRTKILVEFSVIKATDPSNEPSVQDIINDLNNMIKNKDT